MHVVMCSNMILLACYDGVGQCGCEGPVLIPHVCEPLFHMMKVNLGKRGHQVSKKIGGFPLKLLGYNVV
jgi:hypothetical protein